MHRPGRQRPPPPLLRRAGEGAAPRDPDVGRGLFFLQGETEAEIHVPSLGAKHHMSPPGTDFFYRSHHWSDTPGGQTLTLRLDWERIEAELRWRFFDGVAAVRFEVTLRNRGDAPFALNAFAPVLLHDLFRGGPMQWDRRSRIHLPHNAWYGELQWRAYRPPELGLSAVRTNSTKRIFQSNTGSWSTKEALPMGVFTDEATGASCAWQVEHSGSWAWEISDRKGELYLTAGLLSEADHHWRRVLRPGESFTSLPVGVAWAEGGFDAVLAELTRYRRKIRRPHRDNEALPVIFNDYMNCLNGDPTTGKERPLIAAANEVGCEVYCIDAGWFAPLDENWWPTIGAWQPSGDRFEGGIEGILGEIRGAGMTPGLWLELEGMGPGCPLAREWPDACFFQRHGKRLLNRNRYQLDFRHPVVREHADAVVDRLVGWGVGYIKMDYNIDIGIGTDVEADSPGDGLLRHQRAYLDWLDAVFDRHRSLVVENCSSGGLRLDWGLLSRHSIASSSDQQDFRLNGRIAALGPTAAPPEQWAVWAYPLADDSRLPSLSTASTPSSAASTSAASWPPCPPKAGRSSPKPSPSTKPSATKSAGPSPSGPSACRSTVAPPGRSGCGGKSGPFWPSGPWATTPTFGKRSQSSAKRSLFSPAKAALPLRRVQPPRSFNYPPEDPAGLAVRSSSAANEQRSRLE